MTILGYAATHGWAPLKTLDQGVADALHGWALRTPGAVAVLDGVSRVFDPWTLRVVALVSAVVLVVRKQRVLALWIAGVMLGAGMLGLVLKELVRRARPALPDAVAAAPGFSFPSGHALNSMVAAGVVVLVVGSRISRAWRLATWAAALGVVLLVGFSRVGLGVHYLSDVVAGWLVGLGWLACAGVAFEAWRRSSGLPPRAASEVVVEGIEPAPESQ